MRERRHCTSSYAFRARNPVSVETAFPLLAPGQGRGGDSTHEAHWKMEFGPRNLDNASRAC